MTLDWLHYSTVLRSTRYFSHPPSNIHPVLLARVYGLLLLVDNLLNIKVLTPGQSKPRILLASTLSLKLILLKYNIFSRFDKYIYIF
jgi:hypothetical protein